MFLEDLFPKLAASGFTETSPRTVRYNCVAWAAQDDSRWWWPDPMMQRYWPPDVPRQETVEAFIAAFERLGFAQCGDAAPEAGAEKLAIYAVDGQPTHIARQLPNGRWTSKLGQDVDIEHDLDGLVGELYGTVALVLRRPTNTGQR